MGVLSRSQFSHSWRIAIAASLMMHVGVLLAIAWQAESPKGTSGATQRLILHSPASTDDRVGDSDQPPTDAAVTRALSLSEIQKEIDQFEHDRDTAAEEETQPSTYIASQIERSVRIGQKHSQERNEKDLTVLSERLSRESNEKSVDEMARFLRGVAGPPRAASKVPSQPHKPIDPKTAQVEDVRLVVDEQGKPHYIATMVDADGVTIEVELETDVGEQLHRTMKLIKSNPLLERVYRQMVMGLLDKMLKPQIEKVPE